MNILFVNEREFNPELGGVERVTDILTKEFIKQVNFKVYYLVAHKSEFRKHFIPPVPQFLLPNPNILDCNENVKFSKILLDQHNINIIINQGGNNVGISSLCIKIRLILKVHLITEIHIDPNYQIKRLNYSDGPLLEKFNILIKTKKYFSNIFYKRKILKKESIFYKNLYENCDKVVLLSSHYFKEFKNLTKIVECKKLIAIWNPLSFRTNKRNYHKEKQLLYVGRLDQPHKGVDRLLYIWNKIENDFSDWELIVLGDGPYKKPMEDYIKKNKLKRVKMIGFDDPIKYYESASIFCMTSNYEGFPMVLLEAMQFGCVPIAFKSFESLDDIIINHNNGYQITPFDIYEYINSLKILMNNKAQLELMSKQAMKDIQKFNLDNIISEWLNLFNNMKKESLNIYGK